jgi:hypothetical protein
MCCTTLCLTFALTVCLAATSGAADKPLILTGSLGLPARPNQAAR